MPDANDNWGYTEAGLKHYTAYRAAGPISIDGRPDEETWQLAPRSPRFAFLLTRRSHRVIIRNWRDQIPYIGHESKIIWPLLTRKGSTDEAPESACLLSLGSLTRHVVQGRITTDCHAN